jgi:magnesium-transporting ATPase (P-type)
LSEDEIDALPELPLVIARCAPETKVRMIEALHRRKVYGMTRFCVMTGDGVNDSPALKRADCGVAMGLNGSDVAKSVSEIVLADDNFATITRAIKKGRGTLMNLSKFLLYLLSGNVAEVLVLLIGLAFKADGVSIYPISPVGALWINTIAAGPPALALGLEPTAGDAMSKSPQAYKTIFTKWWLIDMIFYGFLIGGLSIVNVSAPKTEATGCVYLLSGHLLRNMQFVIVVWGRGDGNLGSGCNEGYNDSCDLRE